MNASEMVFGCGPIQAGGVMLRISRIVLRQNTFYLCSTQLHIVIAIDSSEKKISGFYFANSEKIFITNFASVLFEWEHSFETY